MAQNQDERAFDAWADIVKTHPGNKTKHAKGGMVTDEVVTKPTTRDQLGGKKPVLSTAPHFPGMDTLHRGKKSKTKSFRKGGFVDWSK